MLGLSVSQLVTIGVAVTVLAAALLVGGAVGLVVVGPFAAAMVAVATVRFRGRPLVAWIPVVADFEIRRATGQTKWRMRPYRPVAEGSLGLPGRAASLRVVAAADGRFAAVHDPTERRLTAVVSVSAPAFVLLDSGSQTRRVEGWGRLLASLARSQQVGRLTVVERTTPDSGDALVRWWAEHGVDDGSWASRVYSELIGQAGEASARHETFIGVSLDTGKARRQIRRSGGGITGAMSVLEGEVRSLERSLASAGLTATGWLRTREIAGLVRGGYEPDCGELLDRRAGEPDPDDRGVRPEAAGPVVVDEHWDHLVTGGSHHAVYWIGEWPRIEVTADFLHPLLYLPGVRRSLSIVIEPVPIGKALREIQSEKVNHATEVIQRSKFGRLETEAERREYEDVLQRERELVAGHGEVRFVGLVSVSAPTAELLDDATAKLEQEASRAMVDLVRLVGQQAEAFLAASLPFGRGMK